jgi:hypothetical protein
MIRPVMPGRAAFAFAFVLLFASAPAFAGDPLFQPYIAKPISQGAHGVAIGDVTGDGRADLVAVNAGVDSVYVFVQNGAGLLDPPVRYFAPITYVIWGSLDIADMNHDGRLDVVVNLDDAVGVMLQTAGGVLAPFTAYPTQHSSFSNAYLIRTGDLNSDGWADAVSIDWGTQSDEVDVFLQNAGGTLAAPQVYAVAHQGYDDLEVADVNGDGRDDIVVMSGQSYDTDNLGILLQQPGGGFNGAVHYDLGFDENTSGVGVGDVNGDGRNDVLVAHGGNGGKLGVFLQTPGGTLAAPFDLESYDIPGPIETADIDKDGKQDVVVLHSGWLRLGVYLQAGGALLDEDLYPVPYGSYGPHSLALGDLNNDTWPDAAIADGLGVTILYNTAPGATAITASVMSAEPSSDRVDLAWQLGGEVGSVTIERSAAAGDWQAIGTVPVDGEGRVRFTDRDVVAGGRYGYRLSFLDEGEFVLAGEVWVEVATMALALHGARPNPSGQDLNVSLALPNAAPATLELLDVTGRRLASRDVGTLGAGPHLVDLTPGRALVPGVYWLRLTHGLGVRTAKAVVL